MTRSALTPAGGFTIDRDHPALAGHFPGHPVVPGAVLLDHALALVTAAHGLSGGIASIPRVKFLAPVLPDQHVHVASGQSGARLSFQAEVGGRVVLAGQCELDR